MANTVKNLNLLSRFCGPRTLEKLTVKNLQAAYPIQKADVAILFGGSILAGGDILAKAIQNDIAKTYMIVGGQGHTTETLMTEMQKECPDLKADSEAELFGAYLKENYQLTADFLETESTNSGNNVTNALAVLNEHDITPNSLILIQDAAMQKRITAGFRKYLPEAVLIDYAAYQAEFVETSTGLAFKKPIKGMWSPERYISLLLGEIPRLTDDENGYGPKGADYIAHVAISAEVRQAFLELKEEFPDLVRKADPKYASIKGGKTC